MAAAPQPVVDGNAVLDSSTGMQFVPHGVNFPGFEYACQQGWSYGEAGTDPDEAGSTVAAMAAWKINTVRLPLNQDCWLGEDGLPAGAHTAAGYRQAVESFVDALNAVGIVAILDLHWTGPAGVQADGLRPMPDDRSPAFWYSVARRFKDHPSVIFDLFNEPHSRWNAGSLKVFGLSWECWASGGCQAPAEPDTALISGLSWYRASGMKALTAMVRNAGATQPILLSGIDYANDLRGWRGSAPDDDQLIAGFHNYPVQRCHTTSCWNEEIASLNEKVPVLAAEFGQNDCGNPDHVNRFMAWADSERIGYLAWAWWALPGVGCQNYALVSSLDGTPLAPVGTALHDHLAKLPDQLPVAREPATPRLAISKANWNGRFLNLRVAVSRDATRSIRARVRLVSSEPTAARTRRVRLVQRQLKARSGIASMLLRVRTGLKPTLISVAYPGDELLLPRTVRGKPASVSRITRNRLGA